MLKFFLKIALFYLKNKRFVGFVCLLVPHGCRRFVLVSLIHNISDNEL